MECQPWYDLLFEQAIRATNSGDQAMKLPDPRNKDIVVYVGGELVHRD